jgi:hypothetical protein
MMQINTPDSEKRVSSQYLVKSYFKTRREGRGASLQRPLQHRKREQRENHASTNNKSILKYFPITLNVLKLY